MSCNAVFGIEDATPRPAATGGAGHGGGGVGGTGVGGELGVACETGSACASGWCVDGVCCDSACTATCHFCALDDALGACTPAPAGTDPRVECAGTTCDGNGNCDVGVPVWASAIEVPDGSSVNDVAIDSQGNIVLVGYHSGPVVSWGLDGTSDAYVDAFVAKLDPDGAFLWAQEITGSGIQRARAVALTAADEILVVGHYRQDSAFPSPCGSLLTTTVQDVFISKFGTAGDCRWAKKHGGDNNQFGTVVASDPLGTVLLGGQFQNELTIVQGGALSADGLQDAFIIRRAADGSMGPGARFGGPGATLTMNGLRRDSQGNLVVVGSLNGTMTIPGGNPLASNGVARMFTARLDSNMAHLFSEVCSGDAQTPKSLALAADDHAVVVGGFQGVMSCDGAQASNADTTTNDVFVLERDPSGSVAWLKSYGGVDEQMAHDVDVDAMGNIIVVGRMETALDFGGELLTGEGEGDVFVAKLSASGDRLWSRRYGDNQEQIASAVATDADGNIVVAGTFSGNFTVGTKVLSSSGDGGWLFVIKLTP